MADTLSINGQASSATPSTAINGQAPDNEKRDTAPDNGNMPGQRHRERHKLDSDFLHNAIIGFSDGLTVPFALCAALSTLDDSKVVISGGLAELFAGSLSMGIGAVLASLNEKTHYRVEEAREIRGVREDSLAEEQEIYEIFERYGIEREDVRGAVRALRSNEEMWVQFMMDFELRLSKPSTKKAPLDGLVMGVSYFLGGLLPMVPYFAIRHDVQLALYISIAITAIVALIFGWLRAQSIRASHMECLKSAVWTLALCAVATGVSYGIVWGIAHHYKG